MKYFSWLILIGILIFIGSGCQNDREIAFKELTQAAQQVGASPQYVQARRRPPIHSNLASNSLGCLVER